MRLHRALLFASALLFACGGPDGTDAGGLDADGVDAGGFDAGDDPVELVTVSHERELRGVWIATVFNINWPSRTGLSAAQMQSEMEALLDTAQASGMNAVFLQVRAESDAFYASELEPWSRFLTGTQGEDPGYDPLAHAIEQAHARGLELHAWVNPYRALATSNLGVTSAEHVTQTDPGLVVPYGNFHWYDPGNSQGRERTLAVLRDLLTRYAVDGLHFDDYFYPYPEAGVSFADDASYAAYQGSGGALVRDDWRRENVHTMVSAVHALVREVRPEARFGISPFGIYRPGMPAGISGLDQYAQLYADPLRWLDEGWVDYLAPQLYWPTTRAAQDYRLLLGWWADRAAAAERDLLIGNYLAQLDSAPEWSVSELRTQVTLTRGARDRRARGNIQYHVDPLVENRSGIRDVFAEDLYREPAASPALPLAEGAVSAPTVGVDGADVTLAHDGSLRYYAAYLREDDAWVLRGLVPAVESRATLWRGEWAISAIDLSGLESGGVPVSVEEGEPPTVEPPPSGADCTHSFGGVYAHQGCSPSFQCCDGTWVDRSVSGCGPCVCEEATGNVGCRP